MTESTKVPGTVEDSHAKLAAEMRDWDDGRFQVEIGEVVQWADRVEQLGQFLANALKEHDIEFRKRRILEEQREAREAEIVKVVAKLRNIAKQMNDAPFDYAELIGDWNEGIRLACQELDAARLGGAE